MCPGLFNQDGLDWGRARRLIVPAFSPHNVRTMVPAIAKVRLPPAGVLHFLVRYGAPSERREPIATLSLYCPHVSLAPRLKSVPCLSGAYHVVGAYGLVLCMAHQKIGVLSSHVFPVPPQIASPTPPERVSLVLTILTLIGSSSVMWDAAFGSTSNKRFDFEQSPRWRQF